MAGEVVGLKAYRLGQCTANTDLTGKWAIFGAFLEGTYYAGVASMMVRDRTGTYHCGADWSLAAQY